MRRTNERSKKLPFSHKLVIALVIVVVFRAFQVTYEVTNVLAVLQDLDIQDAPYIDAIETIEDDSELWRGQGGLKQNTKHSHLGARVSTIETSVSQMIVDPSPKRLKDGQTNPMFGIDPDISCPENGIGIETERGKQVLLMVKNGIKKTNDRVEERKRKSNILCMVYTADVPSSRSNLIAQADTWGRKCDGFFTSSNITDHSNGSIDLVHEGPETYDNNVWQTIRSMWAYAYEHYLDEYDFFHIAGDDVYIVMENLRAFLDGPKVLDLENGMLQKRQASRFHRKDATKWLKASDNPLDENYGILGRPLWFGKACRKWGIIIPCGGTYTLNRAALEVIGRLRLDSFLVNNTDSDENVSIGRIFSSLGIMISYTFDGVGHRYEKGPSLLISKHRSSPRKKNYQFGGVTEQISAMYQLKREAKNRTIADLMYRYHAILYEFCDERKYIQFSDPDTDTSLRPTNQSKQTFRGKADVCFVSSAYSKSAEHMDMLANIKNESPYLRFFLFTNLNDKQWETPGWYKLNPPLNYSRTITRSRFGKFLGWKIPEIRESCKVVFYFDACLAPNKNQTLWRELARQISNSESGLMQKVHPKNRTGVLSEFLAIQDSKKDIESNIIASLQWMIAQPDFDPKAPVYENDNFGYDPNNKAFQKVSQAFWDRYSLELDSWRDQPLWAFMMHRYNITPVPWPNTELTEACTGRMGHHGHEYHSEEEVLW